MAEVIFHKRVQFYWKMGLLAATTLALIPILYFQDQFAAKIYLWFLVIVHLTGLILVFWDVKKEDIAPTKKGLVGRAMGLLTMSILLYFVSKGITTSLGSFIFWFSFFASWALHTAGVALMHLRTKKEEAEMAKMT